MLRFPLHLTETVLVSSRFSVTFLYVYQWYVPWYTCTMLWHGTMVPWYTCTYDLAFTMVPYGTMVLEYHGSMAIPRSTCRTHGTCRYTCTTYVRTVPWYVVRLYHMVRTCTYTNVPGTRVHSSTMVVEYTCTIITLSRKRLEIQAPGH